MFLNKIKFYSRTLAIALLLFGGSNILSSSSNYFALSRLQAAASEDFKIAQTDDSSEQLEPIRELLQENVQALEAEDLDAAMNTIHPDSPQIANTRKITEQFFEDYDLDYEADNLEVLDLSESDATVRIVQTTKKKTGAEFRDNVTTAIHSLKKQNGKWKFFNLLEIENVEYLK